MLQVITKFLSTNLFHISYRSYLTGGGKKKLVQIAGVALTYTHTTVCKQTAGGKLLQCTGSSARRSRGGGREGQEGGNECILTDESCYHTAEINAS